MSRILLLSDTHSFLDDAFIKYAENCDEIWHAGDIGDIQVCDKIKTIKPLRAVFGNIDGQEIRKEYPENLVFMCDKVKVLITHIGGYPGRYNLDAKKLIEQEKPQLFVCGHSHILKVMYDKKYQMLCMNPGAYGIHGFHHMRTMLRFEIQEADIKNLELIEIGLRVGR